jgi:type IV secretion system protein VirB9
MLLAASSAVAQSPVAGAGDAPAGVPLKGIRAPRQQDVSAPSPFASTVAAAAPSETGTGAPSFRAPIDVEYSPDVVPIIQTRIRYVTVIVLPAAERIIEAVCGDKDWWQIEAIENMLYVKPAKASISTNLTILGKSGTLYGFALEEITELANAKPHVKVTVRWPQSIQTEQIARGPKFVTRAEHDAVIEDYQRQLQIAAENVRTVQTAAKNVLQDEVTKMRTQYPAELEFTYDIALDTKPFYVRAMYTDKKFTYLKLEAAEAPAIYEIQDGKPNLVNFDYVNGVFIVRKVVDQGYLAIGKAKLRFNRRTQ